MELCDLEGFDSHHKVIILKIMKLELNLHNQVSREL